MIVERVIEVRVAPSGPPPTERSISVTRAPSTPGPSAVLRVVCGERAAPIAERLPRPALRDSAPPSVTILLTPSEHTVLDRLHRFRRDEEGFVGSIADTASSALGVLDDWPSGDDEAGIATSAMVRYRTTWERERQSVPVSLQLSDAEAATLRRIAARFDWLLEDAARYAIRRLHDIYEDQVDLGPENAAPAFAVPGGPVEPPEPEPPWPALVGRAGVEELLRLAPERCDPRAASALLAALALAVDPREPFGVVAAMVHLLEAGRSLHARGRAAGNVDLRRGGVELVLLYRRCAVALRRVVHRDLKPENLADRRTAGRGPTATPVLFGQPTAPASPPRPPAQATVLVKAPPPEAPAVCRTEAPTARGAPSAPVQLSAACRGAEQDAQKSAISPTAQPVQLHRSSRAGEQPPLRNAAAVRRPAPVPPPAKALAYKDIAGKQEVELIKRFQAGDRHAGDILLQAHERLIISLAMRYRDRGLDDEDLVQWARMGLLHAAARWKEDGGATLASYAFTWIRQYLRRALDDEGTTIRVPVHLQTRIRALHRRGEELPSGMARAFRLLKSVSLDAPVGKDDSATFGDLLADENAFSPAEVMAEMDLVERLRGSLQDLPTCEEKIVRMRFGIGEDGDHVLDRVGHDSEVTRERIRQIEAKAVAEAARRAPRALGNERVRRALERHSVDEADASEAYTTLRADGVAAGDIESALGCATPEPKPLAKARPTAGAALSRGETRSRRLRDVRSQTISIKRLPKRDLELGRILHPESGHSAPRTRSECLGTTRPCPHVSCRHHLYLDVTPNTGAIKLNFPDVDVGEMRESCSLDVADRGGATLNEVGAIMNVTRERVRQIEVDALARLKPRLRKLVDDEPAGARSGARRLPVLQPTKETAGEPPSSPMCHEPGPTSGPVSSAETTWPWEIA